MFDSVLNMSQVLNIGFWIYFKFYICQGSEYLRKTKYKNNFLKKNLMKSPFLKIRKAFLRKYKRYKKYKKYNKFF